MNLTVETDALFWRPLLYKGGGGGEGGGGGGKYEHLVTKVHEMKTLHTKAGCYTPPSLKVIEMMAHIALPTHN